MDDFLNGHYYTCYQDAHQLNIHRVGIYNVKKILKSRKDLVEQFFTISKLTSPKIDELIELFYTTESPLSSWHTTVDSTTKKKLLFGCTFDDFQLSLITDCINETQLFSVPVDNDTLCAFFNGTIVAPLKSANNRLLAYFFDAMREQNLIIGKWQQAIELSRSILSSASNKPLNHSQLATALNEAKANPTCFHETIRICMQHVKEYTKKQ